MATNLVELANAPFNEPVIRKISGILGTTETTTRSGLAAAVPSMVGGLVQQGSTPSGASALAATLDRYDTRAADDLGASLDGQTSHDLMRSGSGMARNILGGSLEAVTTAIGRASGMNKPAISSLLGLVAPVVMGALAKYKRSQGLDVNGLARFLGEQRSYVASALPAGVADALGLDVGAGAARAHEYGRAQAGARERATEPAGQPRRSWARPALALLLLALVVFLGWRMIGAGDRDETARAGDARQGTAREAAAPTTDVVTREVRSVLDGATSALSSVRDEASARAALPRLEAATTSVTELSGRVRTLPQSARDSVGQLVRTSLPNLRSQADRAMRNPGVHEVLSPAVERLTGELSKLQP